MVDYYVLRVPSNLQGAGLPLEEELSSINLYFPPISLSSINLCFLISFSAQEFENMPNLILQERLINALYTSPSKSVIKIVTNAGSDTSLCSTSAG